MSFDAEVELPKFVVAKTVCAELNHYCMRSVLFHDSRHDIFEEVEVVFV